MCNEREKLIAYLYDEADASERRAVDQHLAECETCREELRAFRGVREDLLAWDVPPHESVWKPFVAVRPTPVWRQVPAWSLAAAATLVFAIGGAGGFAGRVLASQMSAAPQVAAIPPVEPVSATPAASPALTEELRALSTRLSEIEHAASARTVSAAPVSLSASSDAAILARVEQMIRDSEGRTSVSNKRLSRQIIDVVRDLNSQRTIDVASLERKINETQAQINGTMLRVMNNRSPEKEQ